MNIPSHGISQADERCGDRGCRAAELPWLLERRQDGERAAAEDTSQRPTAAGGEAHAAALRTGLPGHGRSGSRNSLHFMAGGQLASDALDRLATAAHCELVPRVPEP